MYRVPPSLLLIRGGQNVGILKSAHIVLSEIDDDVMKGLNHEN